MKNFTKVVSVIIFLVIIFLIFLKLSQTKILSPSPFTFATSPQPTTTSNNSSVCHINGVLPDSNCTPGSIDPQVTQDNLNQTICDSGYTKTIRPPTSYTSKLKIEQIAMYGFSDILTSDYEEDHLISLELGGNPTDPKNLWPEPGKSPNAKDKIENLCHTKVCNGQIALAEAQKEIATNWLTACQ